MKVKSELFKIRTLQRDDVGQKIEPEQQLAAKVMDVEMPAAMQGGKQVGMMRGQVIQEMSAGEMALAARHPCFSCLNFDKRAWRLLFARWNSPQSPIEERKMLNNIRAGLLTSNNAKIGDKSPGQDGDLDVEHALSLLGVCHPLTEMNRSPVIVYPTATCPPEVCSAQKPQGLFKPKDRDLERAGNEAYDNIMRTAQGRTT